MNKLKKVACVMIVGALILGVNAGTVFASETGSLKFVVENCNVTMEKSTEADISYVYNDSKFTVDRNTSGSTDVVTIKLNKGATAGLFDTITVYVPVDKYDKILLENKNAGVSLPELNANYDVTCNDGSVSFNVIDGYNKIFNCTMTSSAVSIRFPTDTKNYAVNLDVAKSVVSVPDSFIKYISGQKIYHHVNGNGTAQFNITTNDSALAIKCE